MKEPRRLIVAEPDTKALALQPQDEFFVLASDGLFDVLDDQAVVDSVTRSLLLHPGDCRAAASLLAALAIEKGSLDNVSALVVRLLWGEDEDGEGEGAART